MSTLQLAAEAVVTARAAQELRYREFNAVQLLCRRSVDAAEAALLVARAPLAMRDTLTALVKTQSECMQQAASAWRGAMGETGQAFQALLAACSAEVRPSSVGFGQVTLTDTGDTKTESFNLRDVEWMRCSHEDATWVACVRMVTDDGNCSFTRLLTFRDGQVRCLPD